MTKTLSIALLLACTPFACTKTNPALCCTDAADCASLGISTDHMCSGGLVCVANQCVAEPCTTYADCNGQLPYCSSAGLCEATCEDSSQCPGFGGSDQTICSNGTCVQCVMNSDCSGTTPICDASVCRACGSDSECTSGACGDDGACIDPSALLYVSPSGSDSGTCTQALPCLTLQYTESQASSARSTMVLAAGTYVQRTTFESTQTPVAALTIHGGGATIEMPSGGENDLFFVSDVGLTIRDVTLVGSTVEAALIQTGSAPVLVERVTFENATRGVETNFGANNGTVTIHQSQFSNVRDSIYVATLTADRVIIHGGANPLRVSGAIDVSNLLVYDTTGPLALGSASGTVRFSTIGATNGDINSISCSTTTSSTLTIDSSIVWNPSIGAPTITGTCTLRSTIAGPAAVTGAMNVDPKFVNLLTSDYHLSPMSPAIDQLSSGPAFDFEGDPRPQGSGYDIGADEYKP